MAELGPGDTIGVGLAALLSGVRSYVGLDLVPYAENSDAVRTFDELCSIAAGETDPARRIVVSQSEITRIRDDLQRGVNRSETIRYEAPWTPSSIQKESVDLVLSTVVLESVDRLEEVYDAMFQWLRPGGFACHFIALSAWHFSPYWNGHWAYSELEWRLVRGRREFTLNRKPLSGHLRIANEAGFENLAMNLMRGTDGLPLTALAPAFREMDSVDAGTRGALVVMRRPA
jgi:hypothetical protein